jgi:hypothetical protein
MVRLHWFWRGAIAIVAGCVYGGLAVTWLMPIHANATWALLRWLHRGLPATAYANSWRMGVAAAVVYCAPTALVALGAYAAATRLGTLRPFTDNETHCRRCDYILRGITALRCPECGEPI